MFVALLFFISSVGSAAQHDAVAGGPPAPPPAAPPAAILATLNQFDLDAANFLTDPAPKLFAEQFRRATGRLLVPVASGLPLEERLASATVIIFGPYPYDVPVYDVPALLRTHSLHAAVIFMACENHSLRDYNHSYIGIADASFGARMDLADPTFLRLPCWLPYFVDSHSCALDPRLSVHDGITPAEAASIAEAWRVRPGFASHVASHGGFPREMLVELLTKRGIVDVPFGPMKNMDWPDTIHNELGRRHLQAFSTTKRRRLTGMAGMHNGTFQFVANYRFNICPENSDSSSRGYNTEKLPRALATGAIPIYWGDYPLDSAVFNPARYITLAVSGCSASREFDEDVNNSVLMTITRLEDDASFREWFFAHPVLQPGAQLWVDRWCTQTRAILSSVWKKLEDRVRSQQAVNPS